MTAREVAKITMFGGFSKFLTNNASVYTGFVPLEKRKTQLEALVNRITEIAKGLSKDNTGFSEEKQKAKQAMSQSAATLSGIAQVCFTEAGKNLEASQLHISSSDYFGLADPEASILASATYDLLNKNLSTLAPDYISADDLTGLQKLISNFDSIKGSSTVVRQTTPEQTKGFKSVIIQAQEITDEIRLLARKFRTVNSSFYDQLIATSTLPPVAVNHTTFSAAIKSKANAQPVANATLELSTSKKTGSSNIEGFATIDQVRAGQATLTVKAPDHKDLALLVNVEKGKDNYVEVKLEKA